MAFIFSGGKGKSKKKVSFKNLGQIAQNISQSINNDEDDDEPQFGSNWIKQRAQARKQARFGQGEDEDKQSSLQWLRQSRRQTQLRQFAQGEDDDKSNALAWLRQSRNPKRRIVSNPSINPNFVEANPYNPNYAQFLRRKNSWQRLFSGMYQPTRQENILRQNAAPPGYYWTPTGLRPYHNMTPLFNAIGSIGNWGSQVAQYYQQQTRPNNNYGGGYNQPVYEGGGYAPSRSTGGSYTPDWYNNLITWKI